MKFNLTGGFDHLGQADNIESKNPLRGGLFIDKGFLPEIPGLVRGPLYNAGGDAMMKQLGLWRKLLLGVEDPKKAAKASANPAGFITKRFF